MKTSVGRVGLNERDGEVLVVRSGMRSRRSERSAARFFLRERAEGGSATVRHADPAILAHVVRGLAHEGRSGRQEVVCECVRGVSMAPWARVGR